MSWSQKVVRHLGIAAPGLGTLAALSTVLSEHVAYSAAGVALGLWLAAGWMFLNDPETVI